MNGFEILVRSIFPHLQLMGMVSYCPQVTFSSDSFKFGLSGCNHGAAGGEQMLLEDLN